MKASEVKELSIEDILEKIDELEGQYTNLKLTHAVSSLENPLQIRALRKDIARLKTELRNKEINA